MLGGLQQGDDSYCPWLSDPRSEFCIRRKESVVVMKQKRFSDGVGLRLSRQALRVLKERGIFAHSPVSLEHQHFAKRYVVRGLESGGAVGDLGPEPSSWRNQRSSPRRIGTSEPAARSVAASRPDARSNGAAPATAGATGVSEQPFASPNVVGRKGAT